MRPANDNSRLMLRLRQTLRAAGIAVAAGSMPRSP